MALTGGIASGKTTVSDRFAKLGVPVIDADIAARKVVEPGSPGLEGLVQLCGASILQADGQLDRRALRARVFADDILRQRVNALLHPLISQWMQEQAATRPAPYQLFVIPLLAETGQAQDYDRVLLVQADLTTRRQRLMARDRISAEQANAILAAQADDGQRTAIADDVVYNNADEQSLVQQVESLHRRYLQLAEGLAT
ncbi:MAG TPA: dephospho-CoA kinase [Permianibacter sp.]|nr:dephospho-CoA kinase [Permianibacter sp.]